MSAFAPFGALLPRDLEKRPQQRGADHGQAFACNQLARDHGHVGVESVEQRVIGLQVLADDRVQVGIQLARRHDDRQVVHVVVGARHDAGCPADAGLDQRPRLGAGATDGRQVLSGRRVRIDHGHLESVRVERTDDLASEPAISANHPLAPRRSHGRLQDRSRESGQPGDQPVIPRSRDSERELPAESCEWIDDVVGPERRHVGRGFAGHGAGQHRYAGFEQADGHRDREIGLVVVGKREHAPALVLRSPAAMRLSGRRAFAASASGTCLKSIRSISWTLVRRPPRPRSAGCAGPAPSPPACRFPRVRR